MLARECLEEFRVECDLRRLSKRTNKWYYNSTALFLTYLENHGYATMLESIGAPHIKKYLQYLIERKLSATYINGILKCIRAFFKYAYGEGYITINGIFSCTITDMEKATYQINNAINPSDLAEEVDSFGNLGDGLYGASVASAVMYCSDGGSYRPETMTGTLLNWPDQLSVNRIVGTLYISK